MIKRIAVLSLLLMYLGTTFGFAMSLHFCGTKISDIQITQSSRKPCCAKETESKSDDCCNDKQIKIKVSDQQLNISLNRLPKTSNLDLFIIPVRVSTLAELSVTYSGLSFRGPPDISKLPLTIKHCRFQI